MVFEIGGGSNQPGSNSGVGGSLGHFEQRRCCFASVVAVLGHGTGGPIFWRINAQPKIPFRSESIKVNGRAPRASDHYANRSAPACVNFT